MKKIIKAGSFLLKTICILGAGLFARSCGNAEYALLEEKNRKDSSLPRQGARLKVKLSKKKHYGGQRRSTNEVEKYLKEAGFKEQEIITMVCIARWESSFYDGAYHKNRNGSVDYGLFQINDRWWVDRGVRHCPGEAAELFDPQTNAFCAREIYLKQGFVAWRAFIKHKKECSRFPYVG